MTLDPGPEFKGGLPDGWGDTPRSFGDYTIEREIARGGMGVVYRARQRSLKRIVALKVILAGRFATAAEVRRFRQEAELAAQLDHPHIVPIFEVGEAENRPFFSMKLVDGRSLAEPGSFPPTAEVGSPGRAGQEAQREVAKLVATIARAVYHAHQRGLLHRDLKPANILIDRELRPYVTDFGLARLMDGTATQSASSLNFGTPAYMAPEQGMSPKLSTVAADVYSLGAILYELLTNRPPFQAETSFELIIKAWDTEPRRADQINPSLDPDLATICQKCLRKRPMERYESMLALAEDLDRFAGGRAILARRAGFLESAWRAARRRPATAAAICLGSVLILVLGVGSPIIAASLARSNNKAKEELRGARLATAGLLRVSGQIGATEQGLKDVREAALVGSSPALVEEAIAQITRFDLRQSGPPELLPAEGKWAALDGNFDVCAATDHNQIVEITHRLRPDAPWRWQRDKPGELEGITLSRDGRFCAVAYEGEQTVLLDVQARKVIATLPQAEESLFTADSTRVLTLTWAREHTMRDTATGGRVPHQRWPSFSPPQVALCPDGRPLAVVVHNTDARVWNWETGETVHLLHHDIHPACFDWQGSLLAVGDEQGGLVVYDFSRGGEPTKTTLPGHRGPVAKVWVGARSRRLCSCTDAGEFAVWNLDSRTAISRGNIGKPDFVDPDQLKVAFVRGRWLTELAPVEQSLVRELPAPDGGGGVVRSVVFSKDGRWLAGVTQAGVHFFDMNAGFTHSFVAYLGAQGGAFLPGDRSLLLTGRQGLQWVDLDKDEETWAAGRSRSYGRQAWFGRPSFSTNGLVCLPWINTTVLIVRATDGEVVQDRTLTNLQAAALSASGNWLAMSKLMAKDRALILDNRREGREAWLKREGAEVIHFSPDERTVRAISGGRYVDHSLDGAETGSGAASGSVGGAYRPVGWTPDGAVLAEGAPGGAIRLQHRDKAAEAVNLVPSTPADWGSAAFSPDARFLAVGTGSHRIDVWDLAETHQRLAELGLDARRLIPGPTLGLTLKSPRRLSTPPAAPAPGPLPEEAKRSPAAGEDLIDLDPYAAGIFRQAWPAPADPYDLESLPPGLVTLGGIQFDARRAIALSGAEISRSDQKSIIPHAITNIVVGRRCTAIHFLGNLYFSYTHTHDACLVATGRVRYEDGTTAEIPFRNRVEFCDWFENPLSTPLASSPDSSQVWYAFSRGSENGGGRIRLNVFSWKNPHP